MFDRSRCISAVLLLATLPLFAADKKKPAAAPAAATDPDKGPWSEPQPATEKLDLTMYARIREEGLQHSHVMDYGSALADDIGPRLTGSPNMAKANA
ncbi:MAG TPA: peptidase M28, partial [Acidobacteriaceae bacterium]|nr:peptidase M28 [Acidobacteriaceae bacterium]